MQLEIQIGKSSVITFPCTGENLLDVLLGWEVRAEVALSSTIVRIADINNGDADDLAEAWYDGDGDGGWESVAERLTASATEALKASHGE